MTHFLRKMAAAWLMLGCVSVGFAQQQQLPPIPTDPNVRIGKLDNGLTYYIRHNELPENRADFYIAQKVGSILEDDHQRGLAHFLEHMCFNGTQNFPGKTLIQYLESIGVRFGENLNAYTSVDETVYNISNVPVLRDGVVDSCLLILHDWADGLTLDPKEIDNERGVIHEEWRTSMGAMMRMLEQTLPQMYPGSKYAHRLPIGTMEVVDHFPYQALRDYYEKWYRPDQQGIVVVGDINVNHVEEQIRKIFSSIEMPKEVAAREYFPVPDNREPLVAIAKDKEQTVPMMYIFFKHDAVDNSQKTHLNYLVLNYLKSMVGNMLNARLNELVQSANPPFIQAMADDQNFLLAKTKDAFTGIAVSKEDGIETAFSSLLREIERMHRHGFTASEYARAKADYLRLLESAYNERNKTKNEAYVNEYVRQFIDNEPIPGIENEYALMNQIVPNIPVEAVNQLIPSLVTDSNLVVGIFCPDKKGMKYPTAESIQTLIQQVKAEDISAYEDKVSDEPLLKEQPQGGKVEKTEEGPFGTQVLTLSNGVRVILKPTDFKADEIQLYAFSPGGSSLFPDNEIINIQNLNAVSNLGGLGNFSNVDLEKVLAGKKASISASIHENTEGLSGSCSPKDFETLMQLTYLTFTAPRTDNDAFTSYTHRMKAALANQAANPMSALQDTLQQALYNGHPRALTMKADWVDRIDYAKVMDMRKDRFQDASDFTFVLVGNLQTDKMLPYIETYLGGLPATHRTETFRDTKMDIREGKYRNIFQRPMETPKATVVLLQTGDCPYTLKNKVLMSMLKQVLDIVYTETVREQEGGTYGVGVMSSLGKYPKEEGVLQIVFDTDPDKRDRMVEVVKEGLKKLATEGPDEATLNKVKEFKLKKHHEDVKENGYWIGALNEYFWNQTDVNTGYEELVKGITGEDLKAFLQTLLQQNNLIEVSMTSPAKQ